MHGTGDDMAAILEFRQPAVQPRQVTVNHETTPSADIVLFPGVRYERWSDAEETHDKVRRRASRYDHLDLDE